MVIPIDPIWHILLNPQIHLPIEWDYRKENFIEFCRAKLQVYEEIIANSPFAQIHELSQEIQELNSNLLYCLQLYSEGKIHDAYDTFDQTIDLTQKGDHKNNPFLLSIEPTTTSGEDELNRRFHTYYRARASDSESASYSFSHPSDLFHVPFQYRCRLNTERYSVPGFPCLYLGSSTFICWKELEGKNINSVSFSKLQLEQPITVIDFCIPPQILLMKNTLLAFRDNISPPEIILTQYLEIWPVIMLCAITAVSKKINFHPEYIIPQLFLQKIINGKNDSSVVGIRYFSTKQTYHIPNNWQKIVDQENPPNHTYSLDPIWESYTNAIYSINTAIPVKSIASKGWCRQLCNLFAITEPYSYQKILIENTNALNKGVLIDGQPKICIDGSSSVPYENTIFARIEKVLKDLVSQNIDPQN